MITEDRFVERAFPVVGMSQRAGPAHIFEHGMSLRDYFAAHALPFSDDSSIQWRAATLNWPQPDYNAMSAHEKLAWCTRADAAYKYLQADAMLEARENQNGTSNSNSEVTT